MVGRNQVRHRLMRIQALVASRVTSAMWIQALKVS